MRAYVTSSLSINRVMPERDNPDPDRVTLPGVLKPGQASEYLL